MPLNFNKHHYLVHYCYSEQPPYKAWVTIDVNAQADGITAESFESALKLKISSQENTPYIGMEIVWVTRLN